MHQGNIYPVPKEKSDLDIELKPGTGDRQYLDILSKNLNKLFRKAKPDIVILQAGCDTLAGDPLASLEMTESGIIERDSMVIQACLDREIPVVMTLGGGYSKQAWQVQYASIRRIITTYAMR
jgi:acetoin utilization deacetylase AcuC-like enzyme